MCQNRPTISLNNLKIYLAKSQYPNTNNFQEKQLSKFFNKYEKERARKKKTFGQMLKQPKQSNKVKFWVRESLNLSWTNDVLREIANIKS